MSYRPRLAGHVTKAIGVPGMFGFKGPTPEQIAKSGTEESHQTALFAAIALDTEYPQLRLLLAIPNGGLRNKITAAKLKAQGVKAGVPDLFLPVARGRYHGLWIEMKKEGGKLSEAQNIWARWLFDEGYGHFIAFSWEQAAAILENYLRRT